MSLGQKIFLSAVIVLSSVVWLSEATLIRIETQKDIFSEEEHYRQLSPEVLIELDFFEQVYLAPAQNANTESELLDADFNQRGSRFLNGISENTPRLHYWFTVGGDIETDNDWNQWDDRALTENLFTPFYFQYRFRSARDDYTNPLSVFHFEPPRWNFQRKVDWSIVKERVDINRFEYQYEPVKEAPTHSKPKSSLLVAFLAMGVVVYFFRSAWLLMGAGVILSIYIVGRLFGFY